MQLLACAARDVMRKFAFLARTPHGEINCAFHPRTKQSVETRNNILGTIATSFVTSAWRRGSTRWQHSVTSCDKTTMHFVREHNHQCISGDKKRHNHEDHRAFATSFVTSAWRRALRAGIIASSDVRRRVGKRHDLNRAIDRTLPTEYSL